MSEAVRDVCGGSGVPEQLTEEKVTRGNSDRLAASFRGHTKTWDIGVSNLFFIKHEQQGFSRALTEFQKRVRDFYSIMWGKRRGLPLRDLLRDKDGASRSR